MSQISWSPDDVAGLIRRDCGVALRRFTPLPFAAGLLALWLRNTSPVLAGVLAGMFLAWAWSLAWSVRAVGKQWRGFVAAQPPDAQVEVGESDVSWQASYGSRVLRWQGLTVQRIGGVWVFLRGDREVAYLPARGLEERETRQCERRAEASAEGAASRARAQD